MRKLARQHCNAALQIFKLKAMKVQCVTSIDEIMIRSIYFIPARTYFFNYKDLFKYT